MKHKIDPQVSEREPALLPSSAENERLGRMYQAAHLYYETFKVEDWRCPACRTRLAANARTRRTCQKCRARWENDEQTEVRSRLTQEDVALQMSPTGQVSRSEVQRLLKEAEESGLVHIVVTRSQTHPTTLLELAEDLRDKLNLKKVLLVPGREDMLDGPIPERARQAIRVLAAHRAAQYLEGELNDRDILCMAWGYLVNVVANLLTPSRPLPGLSIVPMLGVLSPRPLGDTFEANAAVQLAAAAFRSRHSHWLPAPALASKAEDREVVARLPLVSVVLGLIERSTFVLTSLAPLDPANSPYVHNNIATEEDIARVKQRGAVADISGLWYDSDGKAVLDDKLQAIGMDIAGLKNLVSSGWSEERPIVMAVVAGDKDRIDPLLSAIRGGIVNALVSDSVTARLLIERADRS